MELRSVPARAGLQWVQDGFRALVRQPWAALLMFSTYVLVSAGVSALPLIGIVFPLLAVQFGTLGFMQASRQIVVGQPLWPDVLLAGFRGGRAATRNMIILAVLYALAVTAVLGAAALLDHGALLRLLLFSDSPDANAESAVRAGALLATAAYVPVSLAFWLAPALVVWHGLPPVKALFFSFMLCLRNLRAFALYLLQWMLLFLSLPTLVLVIARALGASEGAAAMFGLPVAVALFLAYILSFYATYATLVAPPDEPAQS